MAVATPAEERQCIAQLLFLTRQGDAALRKVQISYVQPAARMRPSRGFCAAQFRILLS